MGLSSREQTPTLTERIVQAAADTRSFDRARLVLKRVGNNEVSAKTIERIVHDVGGELVALRDAASGTGSALVQASAEPPTLAVVQCDGGRIRTRQPGHGPGVHDEGWRETKNACLLRMSHHRLDCDPQPELPAAFCDPGQVAKIAEKEAPSASDVAEAFQDSTPSDQTEEPLDWRPRRLVRTCLSSMACSQEFGQQMARESGPRRFGEASFRAFLGDGLPWNWSIWRTHYRSYVPILDFVHVLSYLYCAALAMEPEFAGRWTIYLSLARACWKGRVAEVVETLTLWLSAQGLTAAADLDDDDPRKSVGDAVRYLQNNASRMDYPRYRQQGLPITTALMESLVKEINYRVKGTEMFWNDPAGAEAILQIRAAALCDDDRLATYLRGRKGRPFVRPTPLAMAA